MYRKALLIALAIVAVVMLWPADSDSELFLRRGGGRLFSGRILRRPIFPRLRGYNNNQVARYSRRQNSNVARNQVNRRSAPQVTNRATEPKVVAPKGNNDSAPPQIQVNNDPAPQINTEPAAEAVPAKAPQASQEDKIPNNRKPGFLDSPVISNTNKSESAAEEASADPAKLVAPVAEEPAVTVEPAPATEKPAAVEKPAPASVDPEPTTVEPAPTSVDRASSSEKPAPASVDPGPTTVESAPTSVDRAPSSEEPAPASQEPAAADQDINNETSDVSFESDIKPLDDLELLPQLPKLDLPMEPAAPEFIRPLKDKLALELGELNTYDERPSASSSIVSPLAPLPQLEELPNQVETDSIASPSEEATDGVTMLRSRQTWHEQYSSLYSYLAWR